MEIILIGGSNDGRMLLVDDGIDHLELFKKTRYSPSPSRIAGAETTNMEKEHYHREVFHTCRKNFNLFAVDGMDTTMILRALIDRYIVK